MAKRQLSESGITQAKAIELLRLHNSNLSFQGFADTGTATPTHKANNAWIVSETGTIFGEAGVIGQVVYSDGTAFLVEDVKDASLAEGLIVNGDVESLSGDTAHKGLNLRTSVKNLAPDEMFENFPDVSSLVAWRDLSPGSTYNILDGVLELVSYGADQNLSVRVTGEYTPLIDEDFVYYSRVFVPAGFSASAPKLIVYVFHSSGNYNVGSVELTDLSEGWHDVSFTGNLSDNISGGATSIDYVRLDLRMRASGVKVYKPTFVTGRDVQLLKLGEELQIDGVVEYGDQNAVKGDLIYKDSALKMAVRNLAKDERFENFSSNSFIESWKDLVSGNTYSVSNGVLEMLTFSGSQNMVHQISEELPLIDEDCIFYARVYIPAGFGIAGTKMSVLVSNVTGDYTVGTKELTDLSEGWHDMILAGNLMDNNNGDLTVDYIRLDVRMKEAGVKLYKPTFVTGRDVQLLRSLPSVLKASEGVEIWGDSLTALGWGDTVAESTGRDVTSHGFSGQKSYYIRDEFLSGFTDSKTQVFWIGRNNASETDFVIDDLRTMVGALSHDRFIIMIPPNGGYGNFGDGTNGTGEMKGGDSYANFIKLSERLSAEYPDNFINNRIAAIMGYNAGGVTLDASFVQPVLNANVVVTVSDANFLNTENASDAANYLSYSGFIRIGNMYENDKYKIISVDSATTLTVELVEIGKVATGGTVENKVDGLNIAYLKVIQELDYQCWVNETTLSTFRADSIHMNEAGKQFIADLITRRLSIQKI